MRPARPPPLAAVADGDLDRAVGQMRLDLERLLAGRVGVLDRVGARLLAGDGDVVDLVVGRAVMAQPAAQEVADLGEGVGLRGPVRQQAVAERRHERGEHGDVVRRPALGHHLLDDRVDEGLRLRGHALGEPAHTLEPGVERLAPDLDDAVGVEHDRRAAAQLAVLGVVAAAARHAERDVGHHAQVSGPAVRVDDERRRGAGVDHLDPFALGGHREVGAGRHRRRRDVREHPVEPVDALARRVAVERVRAQGGAELGHERRRRQPAADDVADGEPDAPAADGKDVVPVAAEARRGRRRQVAGGDLEARDHGELLRQQRPLQRLGDAALLVEMRVLDRERGAVGGELEEVAVALGELARRERADVEHAEHAALDEQGDAEQRPDPLLAQDRVEDVGVVDVGDEDRAALGGDASREAAPDGDADALLDLLLDPLGRPRADHAPVVLEHEDRGRVGVEDLAHPLEELVEQLVDRQVRERRVGHALDGAQDVRCALGPLARELLAFVQEPVLDRERGAVGRELEQVAVVDGELARRQRAHVHDAEHAALDEERDAEHRADALLAQDRVQDVRVVDVRDVDRPALRGDAPGEPAADGDADALLDLLLDALRRARVEHPRVLVEEQDRGGVGPQDLRRPDQQLLEQVLEVEMRERRVGHALELRQRLARADRARRRRRLSDALHAAMIGGGCARPRSGRRARRAHRVPNAVRMGSRRSSMARIDTSSPPVAAAVAFEVERFAWTAPDRLEVTGRWFGLRGHRFMRPALVVEAGEERRRLLALLEHKPWAADDGEPWVAAFAWQGEPVELSAAEMSVAPSVAVELPPPPVPGGRTRGGRARSGARAGGGAPQRRAGPRGGAHPGRRGGAPEHELAGGRPRAAAGAGPRVVAPPEHRVDALEHELAEARRELAEARAAQERARRAAREEAAALRAQLGEARERMLALEREGEGTGAAAEELAAARARIAELEREGEGTGAAAEELAAARARIAELEREREGAGAAAEELAAARARIAELERERDGTGAPAEELAAARVRIAELERERESAGAAAAELAAARARIAELERERDAAPETTAPAASASASEEIARRRQEADAARREREEALAAQTARRERDEARAAQAARAVAEAEAARRERDEALAARAAERDEAAREQRALERRLEAAVRDRDAARAERNDWMSRADAAAAERDAARTERDDAVRTREQAVEERDAAAQIAGASAFDRAAGAAGPAGHHGPAAAPRHRGALAGRRPSALVWAQRALAVAVLLVIAIVVATTLHAL